MIWDVKATLSGAYLTGKNLAYNIFDPRLRTWPQALRMSRWRPAIPQKRHIFFQYGLRRAEMQDHFAGDIRTDRVLRTANPSVSRLACREQNPRHALYQYCSRPYQMHEDNTYPEIEVRYTALPDISNHEFLDVSTLDQRHSCDQIIDPLFWRPQQSCRRPTPNSCGRPCLSCRLKNYTHNYLDLHSLDATKFAIKAWIQEYFDADVESLRAVRHTTWDDFDSTHVKWLPLRKDTPGEWHRCMGTSAFFLAIMDMLPQRAKVLLVMAGGVRIPTWEWGRLVDGPLPDKQWHCLGYEIMHTTRSPTSRLTTQVCLIQDISNQDYAATFNTHLGGYIPYYDRNCFEKANAIDMLIGLGRVTSRLTPNHKQRLYTIMGDLENLSRFWEQILNREANESQRLRDLSVARRPRDETDDSSGEPDREEGVGRHHLNTDHRMGQAKSIAKQLLTYQFLYKDSWPNHTGHNGYPGVFPAELNI